MEALINHIETKTYLYHRHCFMNEKRWMKKDTGKNLDIMRYAWKNSTGEIGGAAFQSLAPNWSSRMKVKRHFVGIF